MFARPNLQIHIVARPVRKKTNWVFAVGRLTACDALAASLCGLVVRVGECGEVSKACAVQRAASAVVSSSPFVQQASLGSSTRLIERRLDDACRRLALEQAAQWPSMAES